MLAAGQRCAFSRVSYNLWGIICPYPTALPVLPSVMAHIQPALLGSGTQTQTLVPSQTAFTTNIYRSHTANRMPKPLQICIPHEIGTLLNKRFHSKASYLTGIHN